MAGILSKITSFARSPQGQRAISTVSRKAQDLSRDPRTRAKVADVRSRLSGRRGGGTTPR